MSTTLDFTKELIRRVSVTPEDAGCQPLLAERLAQAGFVAESLPFGEVDNLWARRGTTDPIFLLCRPHRRGPGGPGR